MSTVQRPLKGKLKGQARKADKYELYQEAVQDPDCDVELAARIFRKRYKRDAHIFREDFCGTAAISCRWVQEHPENHAWGVDLDPEPLLWGTEHNISQLTTAEQKRVHLIEGDVMDTKSEAADITCAFNFSFFLFKERKALLQYFKRARKTLRDEGIFMLDAYGGADSMREMVERREHDDFDYMWDQNRFDPITHTVVNHIHFEFEDGSRIKRAFTYEWRLWTLPEIKDLLLEAGFSEVEVYWEGTDHDTGEGDGTYHKAVSAADDPAWVAYIVAVV